MQKKKKIGEIDFQDIIRILQITRISVTLFMTSSTALWIWRDELQEILLFKLKIMRLLQTRRIPTKIFLCSLSSLYWSRVWYIKICGIIRTKYLVEFYNIWNKYLNLLKCRAKGELEQRVKLLSITVFEALTVKIT